MHIGVRKVKYRSNDNKDTNQIFTNYTTRQTFDTFDKLGDESESEEITLLNGTVVSSTSERSGRPISDIGG